MRPAGGRFVARLGRAGQAEAILTKHPAVSGSSIHVAAILADALGRSNSYFFSFKSVPLKVLTMPAMSPSWVS